MVFLEPTVTIHSVIISVAHYPEPGDTWGACAHRAQEKRESPIEKKEVGVTGQSVMFYVVYSINYKREKERENMVFVKVFSGLF